MTTKKEVIGFLLLSCIFCFLIQSDILRWSPEPPSSQKDHHFNLFFLSENQFDVLWVQKGMTESTLGALKHAQKPLSVVILSVWFSHGLHTMTWHTMYWIEVGQNCRGTMIWDQGLNANTLVSPIVLPLLECWDSLLHESFFDITCLVLLITVSVLSLCFTRMLSLNSWPVFQKRIKNDKRYFSCTFHK